MEHSKKGLDQQAQKIQQLADDINPSEDITPDSLAEATTVPLDDDALGGNATQNDINESK